MRLRAFHWPIVATVLAGLGACHHDDAPRIEQLACKPAVGSGGMVFLLDTGRRHVTWASGARPPESALSVMPYLYSFALHDGGSVLGIAIDRYSGAMALRRKPAGRLPIESWSCDKQPVGRKF